jgi:hypothetical protein
MVVTFCPLVAKYLRLITRPRDFDVQRRAARRAHFLPPMLQAISSRAVKRCFTRSLTTVSSQYPSHAYTEPSKTYEDATHTTPTDLTPTERQALHSALRVDQAGEIAANYIYQGQMAVLGRDKQLGSLIQASFRLSQGICVRSKWLVTGHVGPREETSGGHG